MKKKLTEMIQHRPVVLDGAMGTEIQQADLDESDWRGAKGCSEILNRSRPRIIRGIHADYASAGSDLLTTNTFGCLPWVLSEYRLQDDLEALTAAGACLAREAADGAENQPAVIGSLGPGTKLASLGQIGFDEMHQGYFRAATVLLENGVDAIMLETCQDPLQIKAGLCAVGDAMSDRGIEVPIMVSVTIETTGTMLIGTDVETIAAIMAPFPLFSLGINCGMGPSDMKPYLQRLSAVWDRPISVHANAGMPENVDGRTVYPMAPDEFSRYERAFADIDGVTIIGGCCGTTPEHTRRLANTLNGVTLRPPAGEQSPALAGLFSISELTQQPPPFYVGERANATGSKAFQNILLREDYDGALRVGQEQVRSGAHALDVSVGFAGRDEDADMREIVSRYAQKIPLPLMIDSTKPEIIEETLKRVGGRPIINSANFEQGEKRFDTVCRLARRYGAALVCLVIDEKGMALSVERKLEIAERIRNRAVAEHGLSPNDLVFDLLTFTVGSGSQEYRTAAADTIEAIRRLRERYPDTMTVLGLSNVSFGLSGASREVLNSVFLHHAVEAGLTMCIVNVKKIMPYHQIGETDRQVCEDLIYNRRPGEADPLMTFIEHFRGHEGVQVNEAQRLEGLSDEDVIQRLIIEGSTERLTVTLDRLLQTVPPTDIINKMLIAGMRTVGELFGKGEIQLPFVLQSAEVMKTAIDYIEPYLDKTDRDKAPLILLCTVAGDVHDIGKNLVDIILRNNGYRVENIGIKVPVDRIIEKIDELSPAAVGMSGLLVKSTAVMRDNLSAMRERGCRLPVLLGGAALTRKYVESTCREAYGSDVVYCRDAFDGLAVMDKIQREEPLRADAVREGGQKKKETKTAAAGRVPFDHTDVPVPPFWGRQELTVDRPDEIFDCIDRNALIKGRWGYRRRKQAFHEYKRILEGEVGGLLRDWRRRLVAEGLFRPRAVYGYYRAAAEGDTARLSDERGRSLAVLSFGRQRADRGLSIADYLAEADDVIALSTVTAGQTMVDFEHRLYDEGRYKDYHLVHGLSVELAEALAQWVHQRVRAELSLSPDRGKRYSFGYPACPDIAQNDTVLDLLAADRIGITVTKEHEMTPECSTSAVIIHHEAAEYFSI